jgi:DNA replication protein DnaC
MDPISEIVASIQAAKFAYDARRAGRTPEQVESEIRAEAMHGRSAASQAMQLAIDRLTPTVHRWARADAPELTERVKLVGDSPSRWAASPPSTTFVILVGASGMGKTSLACAALRTAEKRRWQTDLERYEGSEGGYARPLFQTKTCFMTAHRLGTCRIQTKAGTGEAPEVERAMSCGWLLLDDLGSERDTAVNAIPDVIFERYDRDATTWITTGLTSRQIGERYGEGLLRRVLDRATTVKLGVAK